MGGKYEGIYHPTGTEERIYMISHQYDKEAKRLRGLLEEAEYARDIRLSMELLKGDTYTECEHCGTPDKLKNLIYIQTRYPDPSNYDRCHVKGAGEYDCLKCGERNRLLEREHLQEYPGFFKSISDEFE